MASKVFLNVLYNLSIIVFALCLFWGFNNSNYTLCAACASGIILIAYFKYRLIKQVKELTKKRR
ncbi:DUF6358 family protein [Desertivirga xinjiangensis]|uniref:DUF6358 family protein n=1 Tax=Desertivirga xinjiangensis TaxID=539206 RepID=UPI0034E26ED5